MSLTALAAGAGAGLVVDLSLFPVDTLKTRLQARGGLWKNGGISGLYRGFGSIAVGSAPGAALFFLTYESCKKSQLLPEQPQFRHIIASSCGEIAACLVRVPTDVIKQRTQALHYKSSLHGISAVLREKGVFRELYRGWWSTLAREIPFTCIEFPLWEYLRNWSAHRRGSDATPSVFESAGAGVIAGGTAAAITTPLDVVRTRVILFRNEKHLRATWSGIARDIIKSEGPSGFLHGIVPRTLWIAAGGAIFLGVYDALSKLLSKNHLDSLTA